MIDRQEAMHNRLGSGSKRGKREREARGRLMTGWLWWGFYLVQLGTGTIIYLPGGTAIAATLSTAHAMLVQQSHYVGVVKRRATHRIGIRNDRADLCPPPNQPSARR